ncbi:hypothetical protein [Luteococcus sp. OSA5]|uniref:hypothetical protein n=1 Tax=Luteococcus sp. OSA5 TaxID=3401630 RepID=UPI003B42AD8A
MPRRVSLPGASELFRPTSAPEIDLVPSPAPAQPSEERPSQEQPAPSAPRPRKRRAPSAEPTEQPASAPAEPTAEKAQKPARKSTRKGASGRVRHDEKITVYVSREELMALEHARLELRGDYDLAVDRGRIVRESIALAMADLAAHGADSELVRRLNEQ